MLPLPKNRSCDSSAKKNLNEATLCKGLWHGLLKDLLAYPSPKSHNLLKADRFPSLKELLHILLRGKITPPGNEHIPSQGPFEDDDFPYPKVGYLSSLYVYIFIYERTGMFFCWPKSQDPVTWQMTIASWSLFPGVTRYGGRIHQALDGATHLHSVARLERVVAWDWGILPKGDRKAGCGIECVYIYIYLYIYVFIYLVIYLH